MGRREGPYLYDIDGKKGLFNLHGNVGVHSGGQNQTLSRYWQIQNTKARIAV